uniref:Uncharacterized protein n=1 Tax=Xiphophorus maculatus TaxID=8083 RepID=A0A3B5QE63_XIPMA
MFPIQPVRSEKNNPLGARFLTWSGVFEDKVLVIKLFAVDGFPAGAVVVGEVSSLAHELRDNRLLVVIPGTTTYVYYLFFSLIDRLKSGVPKVGPRGPVLCREMHACRELHARLVVHQS